MENIKKKNPQSCNLGTRRCGPRPGTSSLSVRARVCVGPLAELILWHKVNTMEIDLNNSLNYDVN